MNQTLAMKTEEYYPVIPPIFQKKYIRKRTGECEKNAISVLKAYRHYNQISDETYEKAKSEIKKAPHDDAISDIMTKVRKKIKW